MTYPNKTTPVIAITAFIPTVEIRERAHTRGTRSSAEVLIFTRITWDNAPQLWTLQRRQQHSKNRPFSEFALDMNTAVQQLNGVLHNGESKAGAANLPRSRLIDAVKS